MHLGRKVEYFITLSGNDSDSATKADAVSFAKSIADGGSEIINARPNR